MHSTAPSNDRLRIPDCEGAIGATTQNQVYARLRNAIMVGAIAPGTALTMRGLAQSLGVSATPTREAMRRLTSDGAVTETGSRRFLVPEMAAGRFEDLIATRTVLECHAARRALTYVSDVDVGHLEALDDRMDAALELGDYDELTRLNHAFHRALYSLNPHHSALPLIESLWLQLGPFQRQVITSVNDFYKVDRHKEILTALKQRNEALLCEAITRDIDDGIARAGRAALTRAPSQPQDQIP